MADNIQLTEEQQHTQLALFIEKKNYSAEDLSTMAAYIFEQLKQKIYKKFDTSIILKIIEEKRFGEKIILIQGKLPTEAANGEVTFTFKSKDKNLDNFKNILSHEKYLDPSLLFNLVNKWDVLATVSFPSPGAEGIDIFDNILKPKAYEGKTATLPIGKNIYSTQTKDKLIAAADGIAYLDENNNLSVAPLTIIKEITTPEITIAGNIFFDCKELPSNLKIKATGSILAKSNLSNAQIEAGNHLLITGGLNHGTKATVGGNIVAQYLDRATVSGNHLMLKEHIYESTVTAFDGIEILGENSSIVGGNIHSYGTIHTQTLGSDVAAETTILIGLTIKDLDKKGALSGECTSLKKQMQDFIKQIEMQKQTLLQKQKMGMAIPESMKQQLAGTQEKATLFMKDAMVKLKEKGAELKKLEDLYYKALKARIEVKEITYPGVSIAFGDKHLEIAKEEHHKNFFLEGSKISY